MESKDQNLIEAVLQTQKKQSQCQQIVAQIQEVRQGLDTTLSKLARLSHELRALNRAESSDTGRGYRVFADTHIRLAGAVSQGIKRTVSADRYLDRSKALEEESKRQAELDKVRDDRRQAKKRLAALTVPAEDAFEELYGEIA